MTQALFVGAAVVLLAFGAWHTRHWLPFKAARPRTPTFDEAPLMLDRRTGAIYLKSSSLVLRPGMLKSEFLDSDLYRHTSSARNFPLQNGLGHCFLISFLDPIFENVHLQLFFENDRLGRVDFTWGPKVPVPDWTNEGVQADVARYRSFLNQQLGIIKSFPHELSWGRVYATKDDKSATPLGVRYKGFEFRAKTL